MKGKTPLHIEQQLLESDDKYKRLVENSPDIITVNDGKRLLFINQAGATLLGATHSEELIGRKLNEFIHNDYQQVVLERYADALRLQTQQLDMLEYKLIRLDGQAIDVECRATLIRFQGSPAIQVVCRDITEMVQDKALLKETNNRVLDILESMSDGFFILDEEWHFTFINHEAEKIFNRKTEELIGHSFWEQYPETRTLKFYRKFHEVMNERKSVRFEEYYSSFDVWLEVRAYPSKEGITVFLHDITEQKKAEHKLHYIANYDELTDLPNRKHLERYLSYHITEAENSQELFAIMLLDLDRFKYINDTLGHHIGDQLLIEVAKRLKSSISKSNIIFRLSGDEFVILIPNITDVKHVASIAKSVVTLFESAFSLGGYETFITASIGVSIYPDGGQDFHSLMKHADLAMYLAKDQGKNRYAIYTPQMNVKAYKTFILQNDLHKALQQNEFTLHFQPKVDNKTNVIIGAETLIRWEHPSWGLISPGEFIPLAEDNGLIVPIGEWIFRTTSSYVKKWQEQGLAPIKVSINVSVVQFLQKKFVSFLRELIEEFELDPNWLEIELTESILINNQKDFLAKMRSIKELGFHIAIDDFGVGYSSLSYISTFDIDTIKLDRSFIKDIAQNSKNFAIASMIVKLSETLNINVIAEGVETMEQLSFLQRMGCRYIQGYLYSKPVPLQVFEPMLYSESCYPKPSPEKQKHIANRRKYFRINLPINLEADMTILSISNQRVNIGSTKVQIENIGPGGLCFSTNIDLPVKQDIILGFDTILLDEEILTYGRIVWKREIRDKEIQYGLEFIIGEQERQQLILQLNKLHMHIKQNVELV